MFLGPNDMKGLSVEKISSTKDEKNVYLIENGKETRVGHTIEEIKTIRLGNQKIICREQELFSEVLGNRSIRIKLSGENFTPIDFIEYQDGIMQVSAVYSGDEVKTSKDDVIQIFELSEGCIDVFSVELLMRTLPLAKGSVVSLKGFSAVSLTEINIGILPMKMEWIRKESGICVEVLKVKVTFGSRVQHYWMDMEKKELLKQSSEISKGLYLEFRR